MPDKRAPVSQDVDDFVTPLKRFIENERAVMKEISERHGASHEKIEGVGLNTTPQQKTKPNEGQRKKARTEKVLLSY